MSAQVISFCKKCERYHVDFKKSHLNIEYETHLTDEEKHEARSFGVFKKNVKSMKDLIIDFVDPMEMKQYFEYKKSVNEPFIWEQK